MKLSLARSCSVFVVLLVAGGLYAPEFGAATGPPGRQIRGAVRASGFVRRLTDRYVDLPGSYVRVTILLRTPSSLAANAWRERAALAPVPRQRVRSSRRRWGASLKRYVLRQALLRRQALGRIAHAVPTPPQREVRVLRRIARRGGRVEAVSATARTVTAIVSRATIAWLLRRRDIEAVIP